MFILAYCHIRHTGKAAADDIEARPPGLKVDLVESRGYVEIQMGIVGQYRLATYRVSPADRKFVASLIPLVPVESPLEEWQPVQPAKIVFDQLTGLSGRIIFSLCPATSPLLSSTSSDAMSGEATMLASSTVDAGSKGLLRKRSSEKSFVPSKPS